MPGKPSRNDGERARNVTEIPPGASLLEHDPEKACPRT
jgi:hypothetical protein